MKAPGQSVGRIAMSLKPLLDRVCSIVGFVQVAGSVMGMFKPDIFHTGPEVLPPHCNNVSLVSLVKADWFSWPIMVLF